MESLNATFALDNGTVLALRRRIKGAEAQSFEALNHLWGRDRKAVYVFDSRLRSAGRDSFEVLNAIFARDRSHVFSLPGIVKEADVRSFEVLDRGEYESYMGEVAYEGYGKDHANVFHYELTIGKPRRLRAADVRFFAVLAPPYARDRESVYYSGYRIPGADTKTFELIDGFYSRDRKNVYYADHVLPMADPVSFEIIDRENLISKDKNHGFEMDVLIG